MDGNVLVEEDFCLTDGERRITGKWALTPVQTNPQDPGHAEYEEPQT